MAHQDRPTALLLDDGELDDVRALLDEFRVDYRSPDKEADPKDALPTSLLVSTGRHAAALTRRGPLGLGPACVHVVVVEGDSRRLQRMLERSGCDFVVRRPLHPEALRLLIMNALYRGPEKRRALRVAIDVPVQLRSGRKTRPATLLDLSARGCRLVSGRPLNEREELVLVLPRQLTGEGELELPGRVLRTEPSGLAGSKERAVAVGFTSLDVQARKLLRGILARNLGRKLGRSGAELESAEGRPEAGDAGAERRQNPRKRYRKVLVARSGEASHVLIGRDLSVRGMRVQREPELALGDRLKLVLYGHSGLKPILTEALVARDDGSEGWFLEFPEKTSCSGRLEQLLDSLPVLGPARPGGAGRPPLVVSECVSVEPSETSQG